MIEAVVLIHLQSLLASLLRFANSLAAWERVAQPHHDCTHHDSSGSVVRWVFEVDRPSGRGRCSREQAKCGICALM